MTKTKYFVIGTTLFMALASGSAFAGDPVEGQKIFNMKCKVCHTTAQNSKNSTGRWISFSAASIFRIDVQG